MSKKSKKANQRRKPASSRRPSARSRGRAKKAVVPVNLLTVRVAAGVLAALSLAGIIALLVTRSAPYPPIIIVSAVLLAFITGLGVFTAIRPHGTARWLSRLRR